MLKHLKNKCLSLTNTKNKDKLKETDFPLNLEDDIAVYLLKLYKYQERLKISK